MDMPHNDRVEKINIENISNIEKEDRAINWAAIELHELGHKKE